MFKIQAIILQIQKIRDNQTRVLLFSREFWKIHSWMYAKNKWFDIWDIVDMSIERFGLINKIKEVHNSYSVLKIEWNYLAIMNLLDIIKIFHTFIPENVPYTQIYDDYHWVISSFDTFGIPSDFQYLLLKIRILKLLGIMNISGIDSLIIQYIYKNITEKRLEIIFWAKDISSDDITIMRQAILHSLNI